MTSQNRLNASGRRVAAAKPDHFWRLTEREGKVCKIRILRDEHKIIVAGKLPYDSVIRFFQSYKSHLA